MYAASKFAIEGLTKSIAGEYAGPPEKTNKPRVRVNMVAPGCISTPMVWNLAKLYYRGEQVCLDARAHAQGAALANHVHAPTPGLLCFALPPKH